MNFLNDAILRYNGYKKRHKSCNASFGDRKGQTNFP